MAKVNVKELDYQITDLEFKIKNLQQQKDNLRDKRSNTVHCHKCDCYWDALYLKSIKNIQRIKRYEEQLRRPTFCHELEVFWECPECKSELTQHLVGNYTDASKSDKESVKVLYENIPSEVTNVREINSKFWQGDISWDKANI